MSLFSSLQNASSDDIAAVTRPAPQQQQQAPNAQDLQLAIVPSFNFPEALAQTKQDTMFMATLKAPKYESVCID